MVLSEAGSLARIWQKMKSDFVSGFKFGQKVGNFLTPKSLRQTPPAEPSQSQEPKKKSKKPPRRKTEPDKKNPGDPDYDPAVDKGTSKKTQIKQFNDFQKKQGEKSSAKEKVEKFKKAKRDLSKRNCQPAPKATGKIRCPKPGGGHTYYDKSEMPKGNK